MPKFVVNATGHPPEHVGARNWLDALGAVLERLALLDGMEALACEILPNETVVARNVKSGQGFVVMRVEGEGTPAPAPNRRGPIQEPFGVRNLEQSVFQENLTHELRTPLNNILGYSGMLMEEAHDHQLPRMAEDLRKISESATNLLGLVDAGLEANRLNAGEVTVQRLTFHMVELLEDAAAAFGAEAARRRNTVEIRAEQTLGEMRADPTHLRGALIEMLAWSNERVRGGVIALDAAVENDAENTEWVRLTVHDTGPAPADETAGLFQVMAGTSGPHGSAAAAIRRSTARELCRKQGGDFGLIDDGNGAVALGIRIPRGR